LSKRIVKIRGRN